MMKKNKWILPLVLSLVIIIPCIFFIIILSITGIPVSRILEEDGFTAEYAEYRFPRNFCQFMTNGHCTTTEFNKSGAKTEITWKMCDAYLTNPSKELENTIMSKCADTNCKKLFESRHTQECDKYDINGELENPTQYGECINSYVEPTASMVCENKQDIFPFTHIR